MFSRIFSLFSTKQQPGPVARAACTTSGTGFILHSCFIFIALALCLGAAVLTLFTYASPSHATAWLPQPKSCLITCAWTLFAIIAAYGSSKAAASNASFSPSNIPRKVEQQLLAETTQNKQDIGSAQQHAPDNGSSSSCDAKQTCSSVPADIDTKATTCPDTPKHKPKTKGTTGQTSPAEAPTAPRSSAKSAAASGSLNPAASSHSDNDDATNAADTAAVEASERTDAKAAAPSSAASKAPAQPLSINAASKAPAQPLSINAASNCSSSLLQHGSSSSSSSFLQHGSCSSSSFLQRGSSSSSFLQRGSCASANKPRALLSLQHPTSATAMKYAHTCNTSSSPAAAAAPSGGARPHRAVLCMPRAPPSLFVGMPAARPEVNACSGLPPFSYGQLLQISHAQAAEIRALKADQAAEIKALKAENAALKADKAATAGQAALISKLRAEHAAMSATNASQAATIGSLTAELGTLKGQLASAQFDAGKYQAAYTAFKDMALSKHEAAVKEAEEAIEKWAVHAEQLEQQAAQAARENAALRKRCNELTSRLSNPPPPPPPPPRQQQQQQQHGSLGDVLGKSEALLAEFNQLSVNYSQLRERLQRRDAIISKRDATISRRNVTISQCNAAINERNAIIRTQRVELHMLRPLQQLARGSGAAVAAEASMRLCAHTRRRGSVPWTQPCKSRLSVCTKASAG